MVFIFIMTKIDASFLKGSETELNIKCLSSLQFTFNDDNFMLFGFEAV